MWGLVRAILTSVGEFKEADRVKRSTYVPQYDGRWVTKRKYGVEEEVWVSLVPKEPVKYVSVFNFENDYVITVSRTKKNTAIETVVCEDKASVDRAIRILSAGYKVLGNVVVSTEEEIAV